MEVNEYWGTLTQGDLDGLLSGPVRRLIVRAERCERVLRIRDKAELEFLLLESWKPFRLVIDGCPKLTTINLENCIGLEGGDLRVSNFLELRRLPRKRDEPWREVPATRYLRILNGGLPPLTIAEPQGIEELDLTWVPWNEEWQAVLDSLPNLTKLHAFHVKGFGQADLRKLNHLTSLTLLDIGNLPSLEFLACMPRLEHLNIGGETVVTDGRLHWIENLPNLKFLIFKNRRHYTHRLAAYSGGVEDFVRI